MTLAVSRSGVRSAEKTLCSAFLSAAPYRDEQAAAGEDWLPNEGKPMMRKFTRNPRLTITHAIPKPIPTGQRQLANANPSVLGKLSRTNS
jgi:hypothetical protein